MSGSSGVCEIDDSCACPECDVAKASSLLLWAVSSGQRRQPKLSRFKLCVIAQIVHSQTWVVCDATAFDAGRLLAPPLTVSGHVRVRTSQGTFLMSQRASKLN